MATRGAALTRHARLAIAIFGGGALLFGDTAPGVEAMRLSSSSSSGESSSSSEARLLLEEKDDGSGSTRRYRLEHGDGAEFHRTSNVVRDLRTVWVRGDALRLYLWKEEIPSASSSSSAASAQQEQQAFYAVGGEENGGRRALLGRVRPLTHLVRLRKNQFDPLEAGGPPAVPPGLEMRPDSRLHLVQLSVPPLPEMREDIEAGGQAKIHRFLTDHTFLVEMMTPQAKANVMRLDYVRWVGPYHPAYKMDPDEINTIEGDTDGTLLTTRYSMVLCERGNENQQALAAEISSLGGIVELIESGEWRVEASFTMQSQLTEIVHSDLVQYVDTWGGPGEVDMNIVRTTGGADYVQSVAGYTGQGVRGEIFDTELLTTHQEWNHVPIIHSSSTSCSSNHGTSCYSNNFARGIDSSARGVIPDGQGIFFCYGESTQFGGSTSRYTANAELINPQGPYRAVFQTSSVGSSRTFFYTTISAETDDYLFQHQILSTQSQSNAGNQDSRPQAWAKNMVSVGGVRHYDTLDRCDDRHGSGGSTGPAEDGRIKPDLSFFYDYIQSASGSSSTSYTSFGGTSSATPQTSGYFGLLFQMWHEGVWAGHGGGADVFDSRPKMSTAKALMINTAYSYDWTNTGGCSYSDLNRFRQGWGTPDAQKLYDRAPVTSVIDESDVIAPLETKSYTATVQQGEPELRVTMVYTDPMGTVGAQAHRINDLSLRVTSPSGTIYWGNNGLTAGLWSTSGGSSNTIDTVENVFVPNPEAGVWTIDVIADEIVQDAHVETQAIDADFALVISGVQLCQATCGNNAIECQEVCDGTDLSNMTCADFGCSGGGTLNCDATCGDFDLSSCTGCPCTCGDDFTECTEVCDGTDLKGQTCADYGCTGGTLSCDASCGAFNTSGCTGCPVCNNDGICDPLENCTTCPDCEVTTPGASCGNGVCETANGEDCLICPEDCNGKVDGNPQNRFCCGDGTTCSENQGCTTGGFSCTSTPVSAGSFCCSGNICGVGDSCSICLNDCPSTEDCTDGIDNDCDGLIDCADPDCGAASGCQSAPCGGPGAGCTLNVDCCSNHCKGNNQCK